MQWARTVPSQVPFQSCPEIVQVQQGLLCVQTVIMTDTVLSVLKISRLFPKVLMQPTLLATLGI